ncbi:MAG: globin [Pseudomonadota bacterium]
MITYQQIDLVKTSFPQIFAAKGRIGRAMYAELFRRNPELEAMFTSALPRQAEMFVRALALVVRSLDKDLSAQPGVQQLVKQHRRLGITPAHFELMWQALSAALADELGARYTPELSSAWQQAFHAMTRVLMGEQTEPTV